VNWGQKATFPDLAKQGIQLELRDRKGKLSFEIREIWKGPGL
jgi:hypothetical protein